MKYDLKVDRCMCDYAGVVQTTGLKEGLLWRPTGNLSAVGIGELRSGANNLLRGCGRRERCTQINPMVIVVAAARTWSHAKGARGHVVR